MKVPKFHNKMLMEKTHTPPRASHLHFNVFWELGDKVTFLIGKHQVTQSGPRRDAGGREERGEGGGKREREGRRREQRGRGEKREEEGGTPAPLSFPGWAELPPGRGGRAGGKSSQEIKPTLGINNKCQPCPRPGAHLFVNRTVVC